mmetsp:Transcript_13836/g.40704  ORF Transcript_13836/g.40704 Transcript_13836/m.40704 type:complete len:250 (+) Transcript_13836:6709-7458(+)
MPRTYSTASPRTAAGSFCKTSTSCSHGCRYSSESWRLRLRWDTRISAASSRPSLHRCPTCRPCPRVSCSRPSRLPTSRRRTSSRTSARRCRSFRKRHLRSRPSRSSTARCCSACASSTHSVLAVASSGSWAFRASIRTTTVTLLCAPPCCKTTSRPTSRRRGRMCATSRARLCTVDTSPTRGTGESPTRTSRCSSTPTSPTKSRASSWRPALRRCSREASRTTGSTLRWPRRPSRPSSLACTRTPRSLS